MTDQPRAARVLGGDEFSFSEAIGGWRGLIESALPGVVFVIVFLMAEDWAPPVIAASAVVAVLAVVRLIQRGPLTQALSGLVGVALGALWAWRSGSASDYLLPGILANAGYFVGVLVSMVVRWPVVGIVMGLVHGTGSAWRTEPGSMRRAQYGTAILAGMFALRLAVQVPLYLADLTAALGTAKLVMGLPLFALTLWVVWLLVKNVGRRPEPQDPPQQT
jgi:hypothetical protein